MTTTVTAAGSPAQRMMETLADLVDAGQTPILLYGAGTHAQKVRPAIERFRRHIIGFIDDAAALDTLLSLPVMRRAAAMECGARAVVLNSDYHEPALWERRREWEDAGLIVRRLYADMDAMGASDADPLRRLERATLGREGCSREQVQAYWRSRGTSDADGVNDPRDYLKGLGWSMMLADWLTEAGVRHEDRLLELGCNVGRNLAYLRQRGFARVAGVEINEHALRSMSSWLPDTYEHAKLYRGPLESILPTLPARGFDVVYSMAVLEHVHRDSDDVFTHIARVTNRFVLSFENEQSRSGRHFPRDYGAVYATAGLRELRRLNIADLPIEQRTLFDLQPEYVMRLFERD